MNVNKSLFFIFFALGFAPVFAIPANAAETTFTPRAATETHDTDPGVIVLGTGLYYLKSDGSFARNSWLVLNEKHYYASDSGKFYTNAAVMIAGNVYYFDRKGARLSGVIRHGKSLYYTDQNGVMQTGLCKDFSGNTYYSAASGKLKTKFQMIDGKQYYFNPKTGALQSGWITSNGNQYFADAKGVLVTGWYRIDDNWYHFDSTSVMKTGWVINNGIYYYLNKDGVMATGEKKINGTVYHFKRNGAYANSELPGAWLIRVNRSLNVVTVYKGAVPVRAFLCSTGLNNATPTGTFYTMDKLYTQELNGPTFAYYCSHITPAILFHSIPAPTTAREEVPSYKFNLLGEQASQGCIRLAMGDAYWLYTTCPVGTAVVIYDDPANPGPLGKPTKIKMRMNPLYSIDPTDPDLLNNNMPFMK